MCSSDYLTYVHQICARVRDLRPFRAEMIGTALNAGSNGAIKLGLGPTYGLMLALLVSHGVVCSFKTSILARINVYYVIVNREPLMIS